MARHLVAGPRLVEEFEADIADLGDVPAKQRDELFQAWNRWQLAKDRVRIARGDFDEWLS